MKKIALLTISIVILFLLNACVNYNVIEKNFEDAGYAYSENSSYIAQSLFSGFDNEGIDVEIYAFSNGDSSAFVIQYFDKDDLTRSLNENEVLYNLMYKFDKDELIRGKFIVIPIAATSTEEQNIIDIFNK